MAADVRFAQLADGREIAYRVVTESDGPLVVHTHASTFPMEILGDDPMYDQFLRSLGQAGTLVLFDKPGIGASDPFDRDRDYYEQVADAFVAVLDAVDAPAAWFQSTLTATAVLAVEYGERLLGAMSLIVASPAVPVDETYVIAREPTLRGDRADDAGFQEWVRRAKRLGASGVDTRAFNEAAGQSAHQRWAALEPIEGAPPVLLIRRRDAPNMAALQWWERVFPDAESVTIEGADFDLAALDAGYVGGLMASFITGEPVNAPVDRHLVAVLFTDLVNSTTTAAARGDTVWRSTLDRYEAAVRRTIERHHGTLVKHTGDGALVTFPSGSQAISAAIELRNGTRDLGLEGRTGIHVGEVEQRGDDIGGIAVHLAARVMSEADPNQIVVSPGVTHTTIGSRFRYQDLGPRTLKGIEQPVNLFAVAPQQ